MKLKHLLLLSCAFLFTSPAFAQSIDGKWNANVSSPMGDFALVFDFTANGHELSGSMSMDMMGTTPISEGMIHGNEFSFTLSIQGGPGGPMVINYTGTMEGDTLNMSSTFEGAAPPGSEGEQTLIATCA